MSHVEHADTWDVEIASGIVRTMTLEELDAAYQSGAVDEATPVRQSGAPYWSTLGAVAGVEQESHTPPPVNSLSPILVTVPPPPALPREFAHLADEDDEVFFRAKNKQIAVAAGTIGVAAMAGLVAFGVMRATTTTELQAAAAAARPAAAMTLPAPAETAPQKRELTEDQRRALLEVDQKRAAEAERKRAKSAPAPRHGAPRTKGDGLLKGGNKHDPMNGNL